MASPAQDDRLSPRFPSFLLDLSIQHALMRVACISGIAMLISLVVTDGYPKYLYALPVFTFLYHLVFALWLRPILPGGLDLVVVIAETGGYLYSSIHFFWVNSLMPFPYILIEVLGWLIFSILVPVCVLRVVRIWKGPNRFWRPPLSTEKFKVDDVLFASLSPRRKFFKGESTATTTTRAISAVLIVLAMSIFSVYNIIIEPLIETASPPVKDIRSFSVPTDVLDYMFREFVFDVLITVPTPQIALPGVKVDMAALLSAVEVSTVDDDPKPCTYVPDLEMPTLIPLEQYYSLMPSLTFQCPRKYQQLPGQPAGYVEQSPTVLASVNFTRLDKFILDDKSEPLPSPRLVQVMLGFTNKTRTVLESTSPVPLIPGMNIVGLNDVYIRQRFSRPALSALGLFDVYEYFPVSHVTFVFPDPQAAIASSNIARGPDVATIRILSPNDFSDWRLLQDYREKSVLKGFAVVGGLWTFLCGTFAIVYGPSLLQILFGVKPISVCGLIHRFFRGEREQFLELYPNLVIDLEAGRVEEGANAFMTDYIVEFPTKSSSSNGYDRGSPTTADIGLRDRNSIAFPIPETRNFLQHERW